MSVRKGTISIFLYNKSPNPLILLIILQNPDKVLNDYLERQERIQASLLPVFNVQEMSGRL